MYTSLFTSSRRFERRSFQIPVRISQHDRLLLRRPFKSLESPLPYLEDLTPIILTVA